MSLNTKNKEYKLTQKVKPSENYESLLKNPDEKIDIDEKFHLLSERVLYSLKEMKNNESSKDCLARSKLLLQLAKIENKVFKKGVTPQIVDMLENMYNSLNHGTD
jgi:hypothetical protein